MNLDCAENQQNVNPPGRHAQLRQFLKPTLSERISLTWMTRIEPIFADSIILYLLESIQSALCFRPINESKILKKRICTSKSTTGIDFPVVGDLLLAPPLRLPHPDHDEAVTLSSPYGPVYVRVWYSLLPLLPLTVSCDINRVTIGYLLGNDWRSIESTEINHRI